MTASPFPSDFWIDRLASDVMGFDVASSTPPGFEDVPLVSEPLWVVWRSTWDAVMDLVRVANEVHGDCNTEDCELAPALDALRKVAP